MTINRPAESNQSSSDKISFVDAVDCFLDELSQLAAQERDKGNFYVVLVNRLQAIVNAQRVSVWVEGPDSDCLIAIASESDHGKPNSSFVLTNSEFRSVNQARQSKLVGEEALTRIAGPIEGAGDANRLLLVEYGWELDLQLARVHRDISDAVVDIISDFERRFALENQQEKFQKLESFVQLIHNCNSTLELEQVGYHIVNDVRSFLSADRVWLFGNSGELKLISCSGVDSINKRSATVRSITQVANEAFRNRQSFSYFADSTANISGTIVAHSEREDLRGAYVLLLQEKENGPFNGVLITEFLSAHDSVMTLDRIKNVLPAINAAVTNSLSYKLIPFRRTLQNLQKVLLQVSPRNLPRFVTVLLTIAAFVSALFLIKTDFVISVEGELRPIIERHIFAPTDATVDSIKIVYGQQVKQNERMLSLRSKDYEFKLSELQNELSSFQKQLEAVRLLRTEAAKESRDAVQLAQLTAQLEQNRLQIDSVNRKIEWLLEQNKDLEIKSPIAGQVISRDLKTKLLKRPVTGGDLLLTVAETDSDWHAVFDIPDRELGYLLNAERDGRVEQWSIRYRTKSNIDSTYQAVIDSHDEHNTVDKNGNAFVRAYVPIDRLEMGKLRVGQSVTGKIDCGRRSLFFIWTRDLRDFLRTNFFWM